MDFAGGPSCGTNGRDVLSVEFVRGWDVNKIRQWIAFSEKNRSYVEPIEFKTLVAHIAKFLVPVTSAARRNVSLTKTWKAGGPWS